MATRTLSETPQSSASDLITVTRSSHIIGASIVIGLLIILLCLILILIKIIFVIQHISRRRRRSAFALSHQQKHEQRHPSTEDDRLWTRLPSHSADLMDEHGRAVVVKGGKTKIKKGSGNAMDVMEFEGHPG